MFFPRKRDDTPFIHAEGSEYAVRYLAFCGLLLLLCLAYWYNFKYQFAHLQAERSFYDEHGGSAPAPLLDQMRSMNAQWGIQCVVHIRKGSVLLPEIKVQTLFIGLNPTSHEAVLILPSVLRKVLKVHKNGLENALATCLTQKNAPQCAHESLQEINRLLSD